MSSARQSLTRRPVRDDSGASAVEYSLMIGSVAAVLVLVLVMLGRTTGGLFGSIDCWSSTGGTCAAAAVPVPTSSSASDDEEAQADALAAAIVRVDGADEVVDHVEDARAPQASCTSRADSHNSGRGNAYGGCK